MFVKRYGKYFLIKMVIAVIIVIIFGLKQFLAAASQNLIIETEPKDKEKNVHLYKKIIIRTSREVWHAAVNLPGIKGELQIRGREIVFKPKRCYKPGTTYEVRVRADAFGGKKVYLHNFSFTTRDMGDRIWVEVNLKGFHTVTVYKGDIPIKIMLASGGRPGKDTETKLGTFYIKNRGKEFFSERFGEGALYWVRITEQYLFHSIPRDREGNIKEDELQKLGLPASHGCIRLEDKDAKWLYENVPDGSMVIIHD